MADPSDRKVLVTADWQLTHLPDDEYRWGVFGQVVDLASQLKCDRLAVLGDVVDRKDHLPNKFIVRLMEDFAFLASRFESIVVLAGNHDYRVQGESILGALKYLDPRFHPRDDDSTDGTITVFEEAEFPAHELCGDNSEAWIPTGRWPDRPLNVDVAFAHECVVGAMADDMGTPLEGADPRAALKGTPLVLAGDVHGAQDLRIGGTDWRYVGAPHHIRFGEEWTPMMGLLDPSTLDYARIPVTYSPRKVTLDLKAGEPIREEGCRTADIRVHKDDFLRVRLALEPAEIDRLPSETDRLHREADGLGVRLVEVQAALPAATMGVREAILDRTTPRELFDSFCGKEGVKGRRRDAGLAYMEGES